MHQLDGLVVQEEERKVCRLLKSLYGLKQSAKQWHKKYDRTLTFAGLPLIRLINVCIIAMVEAYYYTMFVC